MQPMWVVVVVVVGRRKGFGSESKVSFSGLRGSLSQDLLLEGM